MEFAFCGKDAEQLNSALGLAMVCMGDLLHINRLGKSHEYSSSYRLSNVGFFLLLELINAHIS